MNVVIVVGLLSLVAASSDDWLRFKELNRRNFKNTAEEQYRFTVFLRNKEKIDEHNKKYDNGLETFTMKMNHFSDLTEEEFTNMLNKMNVSGLVRHDLSSVFTPPDSAEVPDSLDWRMKGAVTPVKSQGHCGSCWSFSTTGSLEGQVYLKTGKLVSLSEQNLIDCSEENMGCAGGSMGIAFEYIKKNKGIDTEDSYPYEGVEGECRFNQLTVGGTAYDYIYLPEDDEEALKSTVATIGPISVFLNAKGIQFYSGGIYSERNCEKIFNHAALVVGYGNEKGLDFWLVKNSWGVTWGEEGYMRMARNKGNMCGISSIAGFPDVSKPITSGNGFTLECRYLLVLVLIFLWKMFRNI